MIKQNKGKDVTITFESINEIVKYNREAPITPNYKNRHVSDSKSQGRTVFTGTESYEEAEDLLLHGWEYMTQKLTKQLDAKYTTNKVQNKQIYAMQGYQASVPRYLQGMPDSMISSKKVITKQKVLNITKDIGYSASVEQETIIKESVKVLQIINKLESQGYRINLFVSSVTHVPRSKDRYVDLRYKIKTSGQRTNIKQVTFPLVHPSMLRRIMFGNIERLKETESMHIGYGECTDYEKVKYLYKDSYYIPRVVSEDEIVNIDKYYVR